MSVNAEEAAVAVANNLPDQAEVGNGGRGNRGERGMNELPAFHEDTGLSSH